MNVEAKEVLITVLSLKKNGKGEITTVILKDKSGLYRF